MKISKPYFRKKGKSIAIEVKVDGKSKHLKTLPNATKLLELFYPEASDKYLNFLNSKPLVSVPKFKAYLPQQLNEADKG